MAYTSENAHDSLAKYGSHPKGGPGDKKKKKEKTNKKAKRRRADSNPAATSKTNRFGF